MKKFWMTVSGLFVLSGFVSFLFTAEGAEQDNFWAEIARGNLAEIEASNLALQRAQSEQVKQFAQQMVTDHTAAGTELQTLAASKNVTLPTAVSAGHRTSIDRMGARTGNDFDRDYMRMMVNDHERMVRLLQRESERNADADVKAFAAKHLPIVQGHLATARSLHDTVRGRNGNASAGNANRGSNTNRSDRNDNATGNANDDDDDDDDDRRNNTPRYSNLRPNVNRNANSNMDSNANMNSNANSNRSTNRNTNANTNTNTNTGNTNDNRR